MAVKKLNRKAYRLIFLAGLMIMVGVFLISLTSSAWWTGYYPLVHSICFQESANVSTACGGLATGSYSWSGTWTDKDHTFDGDYMSTMGHSDNGGYMYINYTKPTSSSGAIWNISDGSASTPVNKSVVSACFNANSSILRFRIYSNVSAYKDDWDCWNGSSWHNLYTWTNNPNGGQIFEESVFWNLTISPEINITTTLKTPANTTNSSTSSNNFLANGTINSNAVSNATLYVWTEDAYNMYWNTTGLVAWYQFDDNTTNDYFGVTNGTNRGGAYQTTQGKIGGASVFDGVDDYINLSNPEPLNITGKNFTLSAWAYWASNQGTAGRGIIDKLYTAGSDYRGVRLQVGTNDKVQIGLYNGTNTSSFWVSSTDVAPVGEWFLATGSYNTNGSVMLCLNDDCVTSTWNLGGIPLDRSDKRWYIGNTQHTNGFFNGSIDNVRFYNRTLSATEIANLYAIEIADKNSSGTGTATSKNFSWTETLTDGAKYWNVWSEDNTSTYGSWASDAYTLSVDDTNPVVNITSPSGFLGLKTLTSTTLYQESANSTSTSGSWSNSANTYDSDWGTYGQGSDSASNYVYFNYLIPTGATNATWQVKDGVGTANLTIPSDLVMGGGTLQLRVNSETDPQSVWQYYNAVTWVTLRNPANKDVYEEGIFWTLPANNQYQTDLNYTATDTHRDSCWYSLDGGANTSLASCNNATINVNATGATHTIITYSNDTYGNIGSSSSNFSAIVIVSESYNVTTYETFTEPFNINVTYDNSEYPDAQAFFWYYNGSWSSQLADTNEYGSGAVFNTSIGIPIIESEQNTTFFWQIIFDAGDGIEANSTSHNQTIMPLVAISFGTECSAGTELSMFFDFKDEQNLTTLTNANANYNFNIGAGGTTYKVFSGNLTGVNNISICLNTTLVTNMSLSYGEIQYSRTGYADRRWYAFNTTRFTNTTTNNTLYLLISGEATSFLLTIRHPDLSAYTAKYATLLRWYPAQDDYEVVEMIQTDSMGQSIMRVEVEDPDYRIGVYEKDGTLIYLASPVRMACLVDPCSYTLTIPDEEAEEYDNFLDMTYDLEYNATTGIWTFTYNDASQDTEFIELNVYRVVGDTENLICTDNSTIWTGVLSCDVSAYSGLLKAVVYRTASPEKPIALEWYDTTTTIFQSGFGLFITIIFTLLLALLGVASPVVAIVLGCAGLIIAIFLKTITFPIGIAIGVVGGIVIHWMRKAT